MKFLLDQDVYALTVHFLRELEHDVITAADIGGSRTADEALLAIAQEQERIFMTRDRDFGGLVFVRKLSVGVIYLRLTPSTVNAVHAELEQILQSYAEGKLHKAFVAVEPGRHRLRSISP